MKFTPLINKALAYSAKAHEGQIRKDIANTPYIMHPVAVAMILSQYGASEDVIVAGLLHDTIEDCEKTQEELANEFNPHIAEIVSEVSEDMELKKQGEKESWKARKLKYLENLAKDSQEGMMVCAADKIHNLVSMKEAYNIEGNALWKRFNSPADEKLWFYEEILKVLVGKVPEGMVREYERVLREIKVVL